MPAHKTADLTKQIFHRLTVIKRAENRNNSVYWICLCECGNIIETRGERLKNGRTKSCGCLREENFRKINHFTHGLSNRTEYGTWASMKQRCYNSKTIGFENYGGRGITVCDKWRNDFVAFFKDMGPRPSPKHSIERINNDGNYEPGNCYWATKEKQANNSRRNHKITARGQTLSMSEWAHLVGIQRSTLRCRIIRGISPEKAIFTPIGQLHKHRTSYPHTNH